MTKQDEIRDGVILNITKACPDMLNGDVVKLADKILKDEDSQGVVIKVESELPKRSREKTKFELDIEAYGVQRDMLKAGFEAVEPLI